MKSSSFRRSGCVSYSGSHPSLAKRSSDEGWETAFTPETRAYGVGRLPKEKSLYVPSGNPVAFWLIAGLSFLTVFSTLTFCLFAYFDESHKVAPVAIQQDEFDY